MAGTLLLLLLAAFALFDRPAALLSLPGVPLYPAEIVLCICVVYLLTRRSPFQGVRTGNWLAPVLLLVWLLWGLVKLFASLNYAVLDVVRDYALSYYALFALVILGLSHHDSRFRPTELMRLYGRLVPWIIVISPIRLLLVSLASGMGPTLPGSDVELTSHRAGNLACVVGLAVVYLATSGRRDRRTILSLVVGLTTLLVIATQNRGGFLSAALAILVALLLWGRFVKLRLAWVGLVLVSVVVLAWGGNVRIQTDNREISIEQLANNISSVVGGGNNSEGYVNGTVEFRTQLWERVLDATQRTGHLETGWGFGPNLGSAFLPEHSDQALRNPHNSHMTVIARLGLVGLAIWVSTWSTWMWGVLRRARQARLVRPPASDIAGHLALLAAAGAAAMLFNAYFDPSLETPMAGVWLWALFGFGVLAVSERRGSERR